MYSILRDDGQIFPSPAGVIEEIERVCRLYLWTDLTVRKSQSVVAWDVVCMPKEYGGLGLHSMKIWNKVLLYNKIWDVENKKDRLWVKWMGAYYLKGTNLRQYKVKNDDSWTWKALMRIWEEICGDGVVKPATK